MSERGQDIGPGAVFSHFFLCEDQKMPTFHEWYADRASALNHVIGPAATFMPRSMKHDDLRSFHV